MPEPIDTVYPIILCGGTGTRLWPASRESMPKQFARLVDPRTSTFQASLERVAEAGVFAKPTVIASAEARFIVAEQCGPGLPRARRIDPRPARPLSQP